MGGFRHPPGARGRHPCGNNRQFRNDTKLTDNQSTTSIAQQLQKNDVDDNQGGQSAQATPQAQKLNSELKAKDASILTVGQAPTIVHHNHRWKTLARIQGQMGQVEAHQHT